MLSAVTRGVEVPHNCCKLPLLCTEPVLVAAGEGGGAGVCGVRGSDLALEMNSSHTRRKETTQNSSRLELEHLTILVS